MPQFVMWIKIFSDESEIGATSGDYPDEETFKAAQIAFYETGDLAGLTESVPVGADQGDEGFIGGDYVCRISTMGRAAE